MAGHGRSADEPGTDARPRLRKAATLSSHEADEVRAAVNVAWRVDGVEPIGDGPVRSLSGEAEALHLLVRGDDDRLLGYANIDRPRTPEAMIEAFVVPDARRKGIGAALLDAAVAEAGADGRVWAHGDGIGARALAERMDMGTRRELVQMRRPLVDPPLPEWEVPQDVIVRTFREGDGAELLRVNNAAFAWHPEQGGMTAAELDDERGQPWYDPAGLFLAFAQEDPGTLLGFHWTKVHPAHGDEPAVGEVYVVGVDPAARGRGLGRVLTLAGLVHLRDRGLETVMLYVEGDNTAALRTYDALGFSRSRADLAYGWGG